MHQFSGWRKHGKPGKLREFEKLSKPRGKLVEIWIFVDKTWKTQGKWKRCDMIANKNAFRWIFFSWVAYGKILKCPGNLREFGFSKMWPPCFSTLNLHLSWSFTSTSLCSVTFNLRFGWNLDTPGREKWHRDSKERCLYINHISFMFLEKYYVFVKHHTLLKITYRFLVSKKFYWEN